MNEPSVPNKRSRWIVVGDVRTGWYLRLSNCGIPGGYFMAWRGRESWCQPCEFRTEAELLWAVRRRLAIAGLRRVEAKSERRAGRWERLWVRVERTGQKAMYQKEKSYANADVCRVSVVGAVGEPSGEWGERELPVSSAAGLSEAPEAGRDAGCGDALPGDEEHGHAVP